MLCVRGTAHCARLQSEQKAAEARAWAAAKKISTGRPHLPGDIGSRRGVLSAGMGKLKGLRPGRAKNKDTNGDNGGSSHLEIEFEQTFTPYDEEQGNGSASDSPHRSKASADFVTSSPGEPPNGFGTSMGASTDEARNGSAT